MRTPDANLLLYAIDPSARQHAVAREWLERSLSGSETVGFTWIVLLAVLRLTTNPAVFEPALEPEAAVELVTGWLDSQATVVLEPTDRHLAVLGDLLSASGSAGNLTSDAHLATIAIEHGATLASFDADFHRFDDLKLEYLG